MSIMYVILYLVRLITRWLVEQLILESQIGYCVVFCYKSNLA